MPEPLTVIVGAGVSGLTAASLLAQSGRSCLLLESLDRVGGMCRTYSLDGIPFDLGPHVFFGDPDSEVGRFYLELLAQEPMLERPYRFGVEAAGRYYSFPVSLGQALRYPRRFQLDILRGLLKRLPLSPAPRASLAHFLAMKSGPAFYAQVFKGLVEKKTLAKGEDLHAHWWLRVERDPHNQLEPPPSLMRSGRLAERIMRKLKPWYVYPQKGFQRIPELLHQRYAQAGGRTILECGQIGLTARQGRVTEISVQGQTFPVADLVWTAPPAPLLGLLGAPAPDLPFVDVIIVCLTYDAARQTPRPFIYTYHPREDVVFNRIYYPANIYPSGLPAGREGLAMEVNITPELAALSQDQIMERTVQGIERMGLFPAAALRKQQAFLIKDCLPVYPLDYEARLERAYQPLRAFTNLHAVGRQGGYFFCLSPAAIGQGLKTAKHILAN